MSDDRVKGKLLHGQQFNPQDPFVVPFTQQKMSDIDANLLVGNYATELQPLDAQATEVKVFDLTALRAYLSTYYVQYPDTEDLTLPEVLESVAVEYNVNTGNGVNIHDPGFVVSSGPTHGGIELNANSTAHGSVSVIPDVIVEISSTYAKNVPTTHYLFYLEGNITSDAVFARLHAIIGTDVNPWPIFKPKAHTLLLKGQQTSISQNATAQVHSVWDSHSNISSSFSPYLTGRDDGFSLETGVSIKSVTIPYTIHDDITVSGDTSVNPGCTVTVVAKTPAITGTGAAPSFAAIDNSPAPLAGNATASISPTFLAATSPAAIPTSGLYIRETRCIPYEYGFSQVRAVVVDFSIFA